MGPDFPINALKAGALGLSTLGAHSGGYASGLTHPESGHINPSALVSTGLSAIPGAIMGGPHGAALSAALGYLAHTAGHGLGRQAATDHMLGPGYNANTINWQRLPGT